MSLSSPFIRRPIGTVLLTIGVALAGIAAFFGLPVAPLPQIDVPTISVSANLPGASPETMASSVATPLERRLGTIASVTEMTSSSALGSTNVILQFDLSRDINGAARDVQAAINAARADLPSTLRSNPTYRKVNPADSPIMILALTSPTRTPQQIYDAASIVVQQRLLQLQGVGDLEIGGGALPAVRVELIPGALAQLGIGGEDVRAAIAAANANRPKGVVDDGPLRYQIYANDQSRNADQFRPLIVAWRNGAAVRLGDIAKVYDGPEDRRTMGLFNGKPAVVVIIKRQPGANIIATVDAVRAELPALAASLPADVHLTVASERTRTIRASLHEVEISLIVSIILVIGVVLVFLRSWRATIIPAVAIIVSLLGTFAAMSLLGFSLDNLSLMALVVATGFVVDDAIVVLENITRHVEAGMDRFEAALTGAREVGFTVMAMSISLIAVFIPLLFMGGIVGRLFREFAVTLSVAIAISLVISLTTTPMLCALLLRSGNDNPGPMSRRFAALLGHIERGYARALDWSLEHRGPVLLMFFASLGITIWLYIEAPKGFFPQQDTGQLTGGLRADQSISFQALQGKLKKIVNIVRSDPAVDTVIAFTGGSRAGGGFAFVTLKPQSERPSSDVITQRLRPKLSHVTGATLFLSPVQDVRTGGRGGNANYQYTLTSDDLGQLRIWSAKLAAALKASKVLTDIDSDQQDRGIQTRLTIDPDAAARLGLSNRQIDNTLYDGFGQRQVATIYNEVNQYRVVMENLPELIQDPGALANVYVTPGAAVNNAFQVGAPAATTTNSLAPTIAALPAAGTGTAASAATSGSALAVSAERAVPLPVIATSALAAAPSAVNHQNTDVAATISFNLAPGGSLSQATTEIARIQAEIGMPSTVRGKFAGTAAAYADSQASTPLLILAAIVTIYLVLGILYESTLHPLTVISTLPSAGLGALLALLAFGMQFDIIGLIGVILLIGIVKKNAILMIDFALEAERHQGLDSREAIRQGALLRFRPILMTTLAAILGALPLAIGFGEGAELRQPLGIAIIGGLVVSQMLTLLTTPVVYLSLDRLRRRHDAATGRLAPAE
jgi:multidrug efflux pump